MLSSSFSGLAALCLNLTLLPAVAAKLSGQLWHSFRDLGNPSGSFVTDPATGRTRQVSKEKSAKPWPDGSRFIQVEYSSTGSAGESRFTARRTADQSVLLDQSVDGDFNTVTPSPTGANRILARWGLNTYGKRSVVVWDFDALQLLFATPPSDAPDAIAWMPDGALLRLQRSGGISKLALGRAETPLGTASWPSRGCR